ncbi:hypothetical protein [Streptomyces sp. NPDC002758]
MLRASTFTTQLSQTCLCGLTVRKTLSDRVHACPGCDLVADRDMVSAAVTAHVRVDNPDGPRTARVDAVQARNTQILFHEGLQEALSSQPQRGAHPARGRTHAAAHVPGIPGQQASARRNTINRYRPTPNETDPQPSGTRPTSERPPTRRTRHPGAPHPHGNRTAITPALRDDS